MITQLEDQIKQSKEEVQKQKDILASEKEKFQKEVCSLNEENRKKIQSLDSEIANLKKEHFRSSK